MKNLSKPRLKSRASAGKPPGQPPASTGGQRRVALQLEIASQVRAPVKLVNLLRRHLPAAHHLLNSSLRELSIALVGDRQMSDLHHEFLGILGPTDVLTFELETDAAVNVTSGEIAICIPEARRQAKLRGSTLEQEALLYAVHGMLHLNGFDDRTERGFRAMHRREDQILTELGIGPVFRSAPARRRSGAD